MPTIEFIEVDKLQLDLKNYRTVPQKDEKDAINAMISIISDRFYAVIDSIADDGYLTTENLIVIKNNGNYTVKEGNRRAAAMKIIHGKFDIDEFNLPNSIKNKITNLESEWKKQNRLIPCSIFHLSESSVVDRIVSLTHAKGEKASRDPWTSVARARHKRDEKKIAEPILDLLEIFLVNGKNVTAQQRERWSGDFPLTVLEDAMRKIITRLNYNTVPDLVSSYKKNKFKSELEKIILEIGLGIIQFKHIRNKDKDFALPYGIPIPKESGSQNEESNSKASNTTSNSNDNSSTSNTSNTSTSGSANDSSPKSPAIGDPKFVAATLKKFQPRGNDRQKVVTLGDEIKRLNIKNNPIAFCFILRSMFEISAKIYCKQNGLNINKSNGKEKTLVEVLRVVTNHLTSNKSNKDLLKVLHGSLTEMAKSDGLLSVTSLNQLVHNPNFSIQSKDICLLFGNVYPLLEAMN